MIQATEVRKGNTVKYNDGIWRVLNVTHNTPGNKRAIITFQMRNVETGVQLEQRFSSGDKLEKVFIEQIDMEYLYADGEQLIFMNQENYEQVPVQKDILGDEVRWLKENEVCKVNFHDGRIIGVDLPNSVELKVVETEPALKGATVTNVNKPAKLQTGAVVKVPPFIAQGEIIRIDTRTGQYLERAGK
ncbi:MAG: elongation factor P [Planctomycetota bacterium]|jgi:elongation factor P